MLGSALIVFREVLEAALVIGIAMAATRGITGRNGWVSLGIAAGVAGAFLVAGFAEVIAGFAEGMGQELLNATILLAAVAMLGWHNVWMARHGREMAMEMSALGKSVSSGARPLYALGTVIGLAVLREGSEVVLFLYGLAAGGSSNGGMFAGSLLGLAAGAALGVVMYRGLLRIPTRHFFTVTSWMILLLAAGMASQAAGFLVQADKLPSLGALWDSSRIVSGDSIAGKILQALVGYDAHPTGMQMVFYVITFTTIGVAMKLLGQPVTMPRAAIGALAATLLSAAVLAPDDAYAGAANKVYRPVAVQGETEIELRGGYSKAGDEKGMAHILDLGYGVNNFWFTEAVFEIEKETCCGEVDHAQTVEWENILQLTEPGEHYVDFGWFLEMAAPMGAADGGWALETGPMLEKQFGRLVNTVDLLREETFGFEDNQVEYSYRLQSRYLSGTPVELGIQAFGQKVDAPGEKAEHIAGPAVFGDFRLGSKNKVKWDAAVLHGLTADSEDYRVRWQLEFEFY